NGTPANAIVAGCIAGALLTLPALYNYNGVPVAFYAVVSVCVISLYLAFLIPIALRLGKKDFVPGPWSLGRWSKPLGWIAVLEIAIISVYFILPFSPGGTPGNSAFTWSAVNYAILAVGGTLILVAIWWMVSARHWFTGPVRTIDEPEHEHSHIPGA